MRSLSLPRASLVFALVSVIALLIPSNQAGSVPPTAAHMAARSVTVGVVAECCIENQCYI